MLRMLPSLVKFRLVCPARMSMYTKTFCLPFILPVHKLQYHWRSDASLGEVGLMSPSGSAIRTGNIAYSVNSFSKLGQKEFKGVLNYRANHFGMQQFDLNVTGGIGDKWLSTGKCVPEFRSGQLRCQV